MALTKREPDFPNRQRGLFWNGQTRFSCSGFGFGKLKVLKLKLLSAYLTTNLKYEIPTRMWRIQMSGTVIANERPSIACATPSG